MSTKQTNSADSAASNIGLRCASSGSSGSGSVSESALRMEATGAGPDTVTSVFTTGESATDPGSSDL